MESWVLCPVYYKQDNHNNCRCPLGDDHVFLVLEWGQIYMNYYNLLVYGIILNMTLLITQRHLFWDWISWTRFLLSPLILNIINIYNIKERRTYKFHWMSWAIYVLIYHNAIYIYICKNKISSLDALWYQFRCHTYTMTEKKSSRNCQRWQVGDEGMTE